MGGQAAARLLTVRLLLDEHYSDVIAVALRERGWDVVSVDADAGLRSSSDAELFRWAADAGRRIVTENIKDFRPLLMAAMVSGMGKDKVGLAVLASKEMLEDCWSCVERTYVLSTTCRPSFCVLS